MVKKLLCNAAIPFILFVTPALLRAQSPPSLGAASGFALFTSVGTVTNSGASVVTGNVGTNSGTVIGFPPGTIIGTTHISNTLTAQAATDASVAYSYLGGMTCTSVLGASIGGGQVLTPNVYCIASAATLSGMLVLDAQGNQDAIFVIKVNGTLTVNNNAVVTLSNSASACNVYWQVNGPVTLGNNSVFRGTIIANGKIDLNQNANLRVRALSLGGNITLRANNVTLAFAPAASTISASGSPTFCAGGSVTLSGNNGGTWNTTSTSSSITVVSSGTYFVTNTTSCGSVNSNSIVVTVHPLPTASISASGPTTFCAGGSVTLTSSPGSTYLWSDLSTSQSITVTSSGDYSVSVTDGNGCTAVSPVTSVVVNALPTATITPSGPTTFCQGDSVLLTAGTGTAYLWSDNSSTQTLSAMAGGSYSVTVTGANGCTATSAPVTVIVNPLPTVTVNHATICAGGSATLNAAGAGTFSWSPGTGLNTTTGASVVASPSTSIDYTIMGTSMDGCTNTAVASVSVMPNNIMLTVNSASICSGSTVMLSASGADTYSWSPATGLNATTGTSVAAGPTATTVYTINGTAGLCNAMTTATVTVNPLPTATIAASGPTNICQGDVVVLTSASANSYLWSNNATTQSIVVSSGGNYQVTVTGANGCTATSMPMTVSVNPAPIATIAVSGPTVFCQGGSVVLTASQNDSYLWSNNAVAQTITVTTSGSYSVTVTDGNNCSASSGVITVSVHPAPHVNLGPDTTACGCVLLTAYNPEATYLWSNNQDYSMINVCTSGVYWVNVSNGICMSSDTVQVTIHPKPVVNISMITGASATLNAGNPGASFLWNTGATTQTIEVMTGGMYYVTVTNQFGCSGSDTTFIGVAGLGGNVSSALPLRIYPNPSHDKRLTIDMVLDEQAPAEIRIVNMLGVTVYNEHLDQVQGAMKKELNLSALAKGIYFAEVRSGKRRSILKIALE